MEWAYKGPEDEARQLLGQIFDLNLTVTAVKVVKWNVLLSSAFGGNVIESICATNITRDLYSWNMKNCTHFPQPSSPPYTYCSGGIDND